MTQQSNERTIHDGQILKKQVEQSPLLPVRIAERMGVSQTTLISYYQRPNLRTSVLWRASSVLGYNFFFDLGMRLPEGLKSELDTGLMRRVAQLEKENERLRIENEVYEKLLRR